MAYDKYPRGDYYGPNDAEGYGHDFGPARDGMHSSARDYVSAGAYGGDRDENRETWGGGDSYRGRQRDFGRYGQREYGNQGYARRDQQQRGNYGSYGQSGYSQSGYGQSSGYGDDYRGSYTSDGRRFENVGRYADHDDDDRSRRSGARGGAYGGAPYGAGNYGGDRSRAQGNRGAQPRDYDYDDRGFFARAGDEVRSWFGDEEAERRREADMRYDERGYGDRWSNERDSDYGNWRRGQIAALDRDYDEYRRENRSKFESEFSTWRSGRQTQRDALNKVEEHMDVVGSDGSHVGTVDKVRGDRILLTKSDADAGGRHHSIPSSWIATVDTKVTLSKSADEAKKHWRDEERNQALFGDEAGHNDRGSSQVKDSGDTQGRRLNQSFSGTY